LTDRQKFPPIGDDIRDARSRCCIFSELRDRAYVKVDTGLYESWEEVGAAIELEGCPDATKRLAADPILTTMLTARCWQARHKND
jgi:hypothetical protein